jgi:hypothetical protein
MISGNFYLFWNWVLQMDSFLEHLGQKISREFEGLYQNFEKDF